jgi:hypothetical protein
MKGQEKKFIRIVLFVILGSFVLNSVGFADLVKPGTAQPFSIDSFSQQRVFQPMTTSALSTYTSEIQAKFRDYRSKSGSLVLDSYVKNSSTWLTKDIDQATAESIAIAFLKEHMSIFNPDNFQLTNVQLVNTRYWGWEYRFKWTLKPNEKQTQATVTATVNGKTGMVTKMGSSSVERSVT